MPEDIWGALAPMLGVEPFYYDIKGVRHDLSQRSLEGIARAMGIDDPHEALNRLEAERFAALSPPVLSVRVDELHPRLSLCVEVPEGAEGETRVRVESAAEDGARSMLYDVWGAGNAEALWHDGRRYLLFEAVLEGQFEPGYYELQARAEVRGESAESQTLLIVSPRQCYLPERRIWGLTVNLYGLRSERNWGVGDLGDLGRLLKWVSEQGGAYVGINPLHATFNTCAEDVSPYNPITRLFRNPLYIDPYNVPFAPPPSKEELAEAARLREGEFIDYTRSNRLKMGFLRKAFDAFARALEQGDPAAEAFRRFDEAGGESLRGFAVYMALNDHFSSGGLRSGWMNWPAEYRTFGSGAAEDFEKAHQGEILFHKYLQWVIDRQLGAIGAGVYLDLAVGSAASGSDTWQNPSLYAIGAGVGAPPDDFSPSGQNWCFPPMMPRAMRAEGYRHFIEMVRASMRHASMLRIDHALGLFRQFWIPEGMDGSDGAYVRYPHEEILSIYALESVRNRAVIIAEDLGTVSDEVRAALADRGMLSYRLLYFERDWEAGEFLPSGRYPALAMAAVNTHDLPTLRGFIEGRDHHVRFDHMMVDRAAFEEGLRLRAQEVESLRRAMGLDAGASYDDCFAAAHGFLASTGALVVGVSFDDVAGALDQENMPGVTGDIYPNWRRRAAISLESLWDGHGRGEMLKRIFSDGFGAMP